MRIIPINRKRIAIACVLIGAVVTTVYSFKSYRSYQHWQYIQQGLDLGVADIGAIKPWMTMRYVSVAYAVPQEYIFAKLDIPYNRRNSNDTLAHLSNVYTKKPKRDDSAEAILVIKVGEIISNYLESPVAVGLKDIRPWMTIQYISNSTGVPVDYLFQQLSIDPGNNNKFKQLDDLAKEINFAGGMNRLIVRIKESLSRYQSAQ
ncbi:MAG: hypothetical protein WBM99_08905 [Psychromonas sp.]